jgi:parallel beta-helix repeat protein
MQSKLQWKKFLHEWQPKLGAVESSNLRIFQWALIAGILLLFGICHGAPMGQQGVIFYVSPDGHDGWSGKLATANQDKTDGPFATLGRARDAIRNLKARGPIREPVAVSIRGGRYVLAEPLVFTPEDSGTETSPITYAAYPGETPVLSGGTKITGWKRLTDEAAGIAVEARRKLWVADVPEDWRFNQLFLDGKRLPRSATPNADQWESWYKAADGKGKALLSFPPAILKRWSNLADVEINFLPGSRYANFLAPVKEINENSRLVTLSGGGPYDIKKDDPFRIENALEGIDRPGEWSLDSQVGKVYFWPPEGVDLRNVDVVAPRLVEAVIMKGDEEKGELVRFITLRGLTITHIDRRRLDQKPPPGGYGGLDTNDAAVLLWGVEDCTLEQFQITNVGGIGIRAIFYAKRIKVLDNEISQCGGTGIALQGYGPGTHYVNRDHLIARNHVHHCAQIYWHGTGINIVMVGDLTISGNRIHDMPYAGILVTGLKASYFNLFKGKPDVRGFGFRWDEIGDDPLTIDSVKKFVPGNTVIEHNVIHDVMQLLDDGSGIFTWASHDNTIRNNIVYRCARDFSFGIYLDIEEMNTVIENNIVYQCPNVPAPKRGAALLLHQNGRNTMRNNIFAMSNRLFHFAGSMGGQMATHNIFLFGSQCTPGGDPARTISHDAGQKVHYDAGKSVMDNNLYWSTEGEAPLRNCIDSWRQKGWDKNSVVADPLFADLKNFDFRLRADSPALRIGFKPIVGGTGKER